MKSQRIVTLTATLFLIVTFNGAEAEFGVPPRGWGDYRIGLVSDGDAITNYRLRTATKTMNIKLSYRYRYINEGVDPAKNACSWVFPAEGNGTNYAKVSMDSAGVQPAFVIYVLQEEGGNTKLKSNINSIDKMQLFFTTLKIVGENCAGRGSVIIIEPDTWGYLLQEKYGFETNESLEVNPNNIPAHINDLGAGFEHLSDLPNTMAGLGRAIIRTLHKYAPDCYVGCLASHWSVNSKGWSVDGLVWSEDSLREKSAKINIDFFRELYWGGISTQYPKKPGDDPDFIGVEKNGWCAGRWEVYDGRKNWYWTDQHMKNYLTWVKAIAQALDLPVVGWQISIGNPGNPNTADVQAMKSAFKDTFFSYFFAHVQEFIDAGFIGCLVGKGLSEGTDYTLPEENAPEKGWFLGQLIEFDKKRPFFVTAVNELTKVQTVKNFSVQYRRGTLHIEARKNSFLSTVALYTGSGRCIAKHNLPSAVSDCRIDASNLPCGMYIVRCASTAGPYVDKVNISGMQEF